MNIAQLYFTFYISNLGRAEHLWIL